MKNLIIASTSTLHGGEYLDYLLPVLNNHFANCKTIVFIPYAQPGGMSYDDYTDRVAVAFSKINKKIVGLHTFETSKEGIENAEAIFVGGGNTFLLVSKLYENNVMEVLAKTIENGTPYLGCSAGSNITGVSMQTTNDMPIVYPPSFKTLGAISFNLNPHYLDADLQSKHMGETRETRIKEFHAFNSIPVLGLREGSWLEVKGTKIVLKGRLSARLFIQNQIPKEIATETDLSFLK
ncbi:dipeptidase PepE [Flavobacterium sp.]|jgi:dipeptidase E|uniref:dipeptidase PepE n=1 Tax=Flavobacterium sp. TaxID=239 RepID=UPI0037512738